MTLFKQGKRRIVFGITGAQGVPGGIARANLNVMRALSALAAESGATLTVLSFLETGNSRPPILNASAAFAAFEGNQKRFAASLLRAVLGNTLFCFDHVSLSLPLLPLAATGLARTVIFNHGSESWKRIQRLNRLSIRYATKCLTNSHYTLRKMHEYLGQFNGEACPLGLPPDFPLSGEIAERNGAPLQLIAVDGHTYTIGNRMLLLVARMLPSEREKGHAQLLGVLPGILRAYPDVQLVLAGGGDDRDRFARMAREKAIASAVFLPGFLPIETLQRVYEYCFAFVMPSKQEGFGISYLEAMNYGKPCIGCFDQGTEDVVVDGETGFLIHDQNDPTELMLAIRRLLDNPQRARAMGESGFIRLHQQFTAEHHQARVKQAIGKLLAT